MAIKAVKSDSIHFVSNKILSMASQIIASARANAERHYVSGFCCSEAIVLALAEMKNIESPLIPGIATAHCGGMARTGGDCGALTGAVLGISMVLGRATANESRDEVNAAAQQLVREFEQAFGFRNCDQLKGVKANGIPTGGSARASSPCAAYTGKAAEIAASILLEKAQAS